MPPSTVMLVGEGLLPLRCAQLLEASGHRVVGVVTTSAELVDWARSRGVPCSTGEDDLEAFVRRQPFDLLLSVANSRLVPAELLSIPRWGGVNYHNALLPRCAGTHASSWAILAQEPAHGVTWHVMTPRTDAGAILSQARVPIEPTDTAWTLDLKCADLALATFTDLIDDLPGHIARAVPQDASRRSFYGARRKPANAGLLRWACRADELDRLVRALTVSPHANTLASPLVALDEQYYVVARIEVTARTSGMAPGTVVEADRAGLRVTSATHDVVIRALRTTDGDDIPLDDVIRAHGLASGTRLPEVDDPVCAEIVEAFQRCASREAAWVSRLTQLEPIRLPSLPQASPLTDARPARRTGTSELVSVGSAVESTADLLAVVSHVAAYLKRVVGGGRDVCIRHRDSSRASAWCERYFAPYVPLRLDIDGEWTLSRVEAHVREEITRARADGTVARDIAARHASLRRAAAGPVWDLPIVLTVDEGAPHAYWTSGTQLVVDVSVRQGRVTWWFDPNQTPADMIAALARGFSVFNREARDAAETPLRSVPVMESAERHRLLADRHATPHGATMPAAAARGTTVVARVHERFEAQVERTPDATAVVVHDDNARWTYRELNERANRLAHRLIRAGVRAGRPVAALLERSVEEVVALLAVFKAGGVYVPLDPSWPQPRIDLLVQTTNPAVVLTMPASSTPVAAVPVPIIAVADETPDALGTGTANPALSGSEHDIACVLFTSGSTGRPKGVALPHRALVHIVDGTDYLPFPEGLTFLRMAPPTSDATILEIWGPLLNGGVCVVYRGRMPDLPEIARSLTTHRVTSAYMSASLFNLIVDRQPQMLGPLRHLMVGGEALSVRHIREGLAALPHTQLFNGYGPTEGCTFTCHYPIPRSVPAHWSAIPIGRPLEQARVYVLDEWRQLVPEGVAGELYIAGCGLAEGYWNRTDLTEERFVPDPFGREANARMYRSGDRCRWLPDGNLEYLGRFDDMVKLRAFRVEPGEVEAYLARHPAVRQCTVTVHRVGGDARLVAYVVLTRPAPPVAELRSYLAAQLPEYMVPEIVQLESLPLTGTGKIDRHALPAPPDRPLADGAAPASSVERQIAEVWRAVLRIEHVGLDDNFFDLGGTSLKLADVHVRLMALGHGEVSLVDLFQYSTVRALAQRVAGGSGTRRPSAVGPRALRQREAYGRERQRTT